MSLSDKNKKRLKDISTIIKNSKKMVVEMTIINKEYEEELLETTEKVLSLLEKDDVPNKKNNSTLSRPKRNKKPFRSKLFKKSIVPFNEEKFEQEVIIQNTQKPNMPDWAKDLWRKIMFKCHPDKVQHLDLPNSDIVFRNEILELATLNNKNENWRELLYLAALVDGYTDKLKFNQQVNKLNEITKHNSNTINTIQNSLTWHWGMSWTLPSKRLSILKHVLKVRNIPIPSNDILKKIIDSLE